MSKRSKRWPIWKITLSAVAWAVLGIGYIWSTDSILHSSNTIELCGILAAAVKG